MRKLNSLLVGGAFATLAHADQPIGGFISVDTTLTASPDPTWIVMSDLIIHNNAILTIEPGVMLRFQPDTSLIVGYDDGGLPPAGTLVARGTGNWITLRGEAMYPPRGYWSYLRFSDFAVDAQFDENGDYKDGCILEDITIQHAKSVQVRDCTPYFGEVWVSSNSEHGLDVEYTNGGSPPMRAQFLKLDACGDGNHDGAGLRLVGASHHNLYSVKARWCWGANGAGVMIENAADVAIGFLTAEGNDATGVGGGVLLNYAPRAAIGVAWIDENEFASNAGGVAILNSDDVQFGGSGRIWHNKSSGPAGGVLIEESRNVILGWPRYAGLIALSISSNSGDAIRCNNPAGAEYDVIARDIVWCTSDPSGIIFDQIDDPTRALVHWSPTAPFFGDLNGDMQVSIHDLTIFLAHFGIHEGATYEDGDFDDDGDIDIADLTLLLSRFGAICE